MIYNYDKLASDTAKYNAQLRAKASQAGKSSIQSMYSKSGYGMKDRNDRLKTLYTHINDMAKILADGEGKTKGFYNTDQGKAIRTEMATAIDKRDNLVKENNDISLAMNTYYIYVASGTIANPDSETNVPTESGE